MIFPLGSLDQSCLAIAPTWNPALWGAGLEECKQPAYEFELLSFKDQRLLELADLGPF